MNGDEREWMGEWTVGVRLWLERSGEAILGPGRLELLEAIDRCHSISAAARQLGMSYRRAWLLVESINRAAGVELVRRQTGGREGGGAALTPRGHLAVSVYRDLQERVCRSAASTPLGLSLADPSLVHVAVAASLENVLHSLLADFAGHHPAITVRTVCGASDELAEQMRNGLHVDLFLSAAEEPLDRLEAAGLLVAESRTVLSGNRLSAIALPGQWSEQRNPRSLLQANVRTIALADPSCPLGRYTRSYLEALGLWDAFRPRALFLDNPHVVLAAVESGQAEVGLVYRSDVHSAPACRILFSTPRAQPSIRYVAALMRRGESSSAARTFLAFLTSSAAQSRLAHFGFLKASATRSRRAE
jgi:molybdate transport system substrate-binding protein